MYKLPVTNLMEKFSIRDLKARYAILSRTAGDVSITILMKPFLRGMDVVDTSIRLDGIDLPSNRLSDLAGKSFAFPANPEDGYIDGSIYLDNRHHPVDVTALSFNRSRDGDLTLVVKGVYVFELEGLDGLSNTPFTFGVTVSSTAV